MNGGLGAAPAEQIQFRAGDVRRASPQQGRVRVRAAPGGAGGWVPAVCSASTSVWWVHWVRRVTDVRAMHKGVRR